MPRPVFWILQAIPPSESGGSLDSGTALTFPQNSVMRMAIMRTAVPIVALGLSLAAAAEGVRFHNYDGFLSIGTQSNRTASIALVDMDGDGDLDALVANGRHWAEQNYLYFNDGHGGFKTAIRIGDRLVGSYAMGGGDLNGDGRLDIVVVNDKTPNRMYTGRADGSIDAGPSFGDSASGSRGVEVADIDGDGDLNGDGLVDIVESNSVAWNLHYLARKE